MTFLPVSLLLNWVVDGSIFFFFFFSVKQDMENDERRWWIGDLKEIGEGLE